MISAKNISLFLCYFWSIISGITLPISYLIGRITKKLGVNKVDLHLFFSGRAGLYHWAKSITKDSGVALVPDYICNVVVASLQKAGFNIVFYKTDNNFEPKLTSLLEKIDKTNADILLTASIYGSSALIHEIHNNSLNQTLISNNTHWIIDLCQDLNLLKPTYPQLNDKSAILVSFNDKSIPGAMGGAVICNSRLIEPTQKVQLKQQVRLTYLFFKKILFGVTYQEKSFEYSYCKAFPYTINSYAITKVQQAILCVGLNRLNTFKKKKEKQHTVINAVILKTPYYKTASYLAVTQQGSNKHSIKAPYAIHGEPNKSLYPNLKVIHNKGYWDGI